MDYRIPKHLDAPQKAFLWDLDVFFIVILGIGIGIISRYMVASCSISLFLAWRWGKLKSGKHQWYFLYVIYWYLPIGNQNNRIPDTHQREFIK